MNEYIVRSQCVYHCRVDTASLHTILIRISFSVSDRGLVLRLVRVHDSVASVAQSGTVQTVPMEVGLHVASTR